jgi:DNA polymerase-3 subunit delta'
VGEGLKTMILGHERQLEHFDRLIKKGNLGHAYLFHGPAQVGKFTLAKEIPQSLSCPHPVILDKEHTLVSKKENRKEIPIEDIRELKRLFSLTAPAGEWRVAIINEAEKMSTEAANAFLKLLEEPGENTLFILVTSAVDLLPPTIVSRTQPIRFSLVSRNILEKHLAGLVKNSELREAILALAFGRPGVMLRLAEEPRILAEEQKFFGDLQAARAAGVPEIFRFSEKFALEEESRRRSVDHLFFMLYSELQARPCVEIAEKIKKANRIALALETTNVNPRLALEVMLLESR